MKLRPRFFILAPLLGAAGSVAVACNGSVAGDGATDGGADGTAAIEASAGTDGASAADGGSTADGSARPDASEAGAGACVNDQDCNEDPATSALTGACFFGVCMCKAGLYVQPSGKCGKAAPGACTPAGGKCRQMPATCQAGELAGELPTNMSCGDFIEAVCCFPDASCKSPNSGGVNVDFACCMPNDAVEPPICVSGWKVCPQGGEAKTNANGACGG